MKITITDSADHTRYDAHDQTGDRVGRVDYSRTGDVITISHTEVDPAVEGQGVGSQLARLVLDRVRADGLAVQPTCPFIAGWIERHPDYQDLLVSSGSSTSTDSDESE